jgi:hypothetical protein
MTPTMTGARFERVIKALGFTKRGAGHFFGVELNTIEHWLKDDRRSDYGHVPRAVSMVLELMIAKQLSPEEVLTIAGVKPKQIKFILANLYSTSEPKHD